MFNVVKIGPMLFLLALSQFWVCCVYLDKNNSRIS
jgi:hypothetical protein